MASQFANMDESLPLRDVVFNILRKAIRPRIETGRTTNGDSPLPIS